MSHDGLMVGVSGIRGRVGEALTPEIVATYAAAFGAHGEVVTRTEDLGAAVERALGAGRPAVVELVVDQEGISPRATISEIRDAAR